MRLLLAVMLMMSGLVFGASVNQVDKTYQDWNVLSGDGDPPRINAFTMSTDGEGYLLYTCHINDKCYLMIVLNVSCDIGATYPMLLNADSGAISAETTCRRISEETGDAEFLFSDPDSTLAETVFSDVNIGVAFPKEGGKFRAIRFSLLGSQEAMAEAVKLSNAGFDKDVKSGEF